MLIGIDPILGPDLLATLRSMGHGDEIAFVDGNYPAEAHAKRLVRADGLHLVPLLRAALAVLPLDDDVDAPILRACNANHPQTPDPIHQSVEALALAAAPGYTVAVLEGAALYDRIRACHTIVATSEPALYGNVILRKGVIRPEGSYAAR
jgi:L-fucose mutarotase